MATEQVIKVGTILPVDKNIIQSLEPLAQVAEKSFTDEASSPSITNSHLFAWRAFALSLFEYRRGNYPGAIRWGEKSLANADNRPTCIAMSHTVMAMAYHQLNQPEPAQAELAIVRKTVKTTLPNRLDNGLPITATTRPVCGMTGLKRIFCCAKPRPTLKAGGNPRIDLQSPASVLSP